MSKGVAQLIMGFYVGFVVNLLTGNLPAAVISALVLFVLVRAST